MDGRRKALIVANDEYEHEGLRRLRSPAADAQALDRVLGDQKIGEFDVHTVRNEPAHIIQAQIEDLFSDSQPDDVLLLHFSCHGLKNESGELFFAARNTRPNRLSSTAIPADFVQRCMRASRSRSIVLLLDCCYGGAFGQGVTVRASGDANVLDSFPHERLGGGRGRAVITASSSIEYAFEGDHLADDHTERPSVFTTALVEGLATGDADRDEDGWVSLNELYDYVFDRVRAQTPHQTPSRDVQMQGELYLARSRRRRVRALPIPPDLSAAMTGPNMFARLGAVSELRSRLTSDNLPAAAGAYDALVEMARTDIEYVAEAAEATLREAAVQPDASELHFGRISQGSAAPHRTIHLLGPPIARACLPHASDDWIRVSETAEGLDISIDTAQVGTLYGSINVKGHTGEVVVTVDVDLIPQPRETPLPPSGQPTDDAIRMSTPTPSPLPEGPPSARPAPPPLPASRAAPPAAPSQTRKPLNDTSKPASPVPGHTTIPPEHLGFIPNLWALMPALSFGLLAPAPFAHAAVKLRDRRLWVITVAYTIVWLVAVVSSSAGGEGLSGLLIILLMFVATVHAFQLRHLVFAPSSAPPTEWQHLVAAPPDETVRRRRRTPESPRGSADHAIVAPIPTFRVIALGVAGSGKTVFLSSMFHKLNVPMPGRSYFLETDASHRVYLSNVFDEISDTAEPWPRGTRTGETREVVFDCVSFDKGVKHQIFRISYLDHAGELLESEQEAGSTALNELEERIQKAHALLGMLDGYRVLQYLRNEPAGRRYFRSSIQPMIGIMAGSTCPIHFVLTKWDLVRGFGEPDNADENTRLSLVRGALMDNTQIKALVDTHSWGNRIVRLIPVSAVGPDFAQMDHADHILKRPDGEVKPTNVEAPLTAILPDVFSQVKPALDASISTGVAREFSIALLQLEERLPASLLSSRK